METINLSVVIPVYNVKENYLDQCIQSVIHLPINGVEIIVINDGSNDLCSKQCDRYSQLYPNVQVIHQENKGVSFSRNIGLKQARGSWITFVDADDWVVAETFADFYSNTKRYDADIVIGRNYYDWNGKKAPNHYDGDETEVIDQQKERLMEALFCGMSKQYSSMAMPWAKLYRTDFLKRNGITFPLAIKVGEDGIFNFQAFHLASKIVVADKLVYVYRQYDQSVSKSFHKDIPQNCRDLFLLYWHSLIEFKVLEQYKTYFSHLVIRYWELYILNHYFVGRNQCVTLRQKIQDLYAILEPPNDIIYTAVNTRLYSNKQIKLLDDILQKKFYLIWVKISFLGILKKLGKAKRLFQWNRG